ncbi:integrase, catalytic region, zinc finger, CCHC-type containing protein [Tanacetum coccineum]
MLMKPQVFYDDTQKQALGYQNPFCLKKAQQIKPTLYDGIMISKKHDVIYVVDEEETLILEEESRSKILAKKTRKLGMKISTSASRSQPLGNTKNNRISQTTSNNMKNKVEDHPSSVKSSSNKKNRVSEPICNANVTHSMSKKKKTWKSTGKVFTNVGYEWIPRGQKFTIERNRTDNVTEFVNQTLRAYYADVGISHQTSDARSTQQNNVRQLRQKLDLSYLHVFGALCYPTNDCEDLGKLKPKADIGIFVDYAPAKKSFFPAAAAPRPTNPTGTPSSTIIDQDALSPNNDPFFGVLIPEPNSKESSSRNVIPTNVHSVNQPPDHLRKWTKDHPLDNVIGNPS